MRVLIVESDPELRVLWQRHLLQAGASVLVAGGQAPAALVLDNAQVDAIVLNLVLVQGSALALADYARYRQPKAKIVFVTDTSFFSDGSIFDLMPNACAFLPSRTAPEDLAAVVEHHCRA